TTRPTKFPGRSTGIIEVNVHCRSPLRRVIWRFFFQAEDGIRDRNVTGVQTCALPICVSGLPLTPKHALAASHHPTCERGNRRLCSLRRRSATVGWLWLLLLGFIFERDGWVSASDRE